MKGKKIEFFKKTAILIIVLVVVDKSLGFVLERLFLNMRSGQNARISYVVNQSDDSLVIFGSSRANHHYIPAIFKDSLLVKSYNAGIDGQSILYQNCILKCMEARNKKPGIIILDLHPDEFQMDRGYNELSALLPYYNSHKEIQPILNLRSKYEKYKTFSDVYKYNSLLIKIVANNVVKDQKPDLDGYDPLTRKWSKPIKDEPLMEGVAVDSIKVNAFKRFLEEAKAGGSSVYVFVSPLFKKRPGSSETIRTARQICEAVNVSFRDYSSDPFFHEHPDYFDDPTHLNNDGARIYTRMVAGIIKDTRTDPDKQMSAR